MSPEAASTMAAYSPRSSFASRVLTLPRMVRISTPGNRSSTCEARLRLEVPTTAPAGTSERSAYWLDTTASRGSSRSVIAARQNPGGISAGMSFMECTARSARPSFRATSSSLMNSPFPPSVASLASCSSSPRVVIGRSSTRHFGYSDFSRCCTYSACHTARRLSRVAMMRRSGCEPGAGEEECVEAMLRGR